MLSITIVITGIGIGFSLKYSENSHQMDTTTKLNNENVQIFIYIIEFLLLESQ